SECPAGYGLEVIDQQEATLRLVLVFRQLRAACELAWVFSIRLTGRKEGSPVLIQLPQNVVGDFARQGRIRFRMLDEMIDGSVAQIPLLKDERLPHQIIGGIVEILRFKRRRVNGGKARVGLGDDMLRYQLHTRPRENVDETSVQGNQW